MKIRNLVSSLLLIFVLGGATLTAQNTPMPKQQEQIEVSDAELAKFAEAFQKMRMANQKAQQQMMQIIKDEGMDLQRFNEIHQASRNPNKEVEATKAEEEKYSAVVEELESLQPQFQKKMQTIISNSDLSMERYQKLAMALRTDQELQKRLQEIMQS